MKISKAQFRWLLVINILVVVCSVLADFWTTSLVPDVVKELEQSSTINHVSLPGLLVFLLTVLGAGLFGYIGMFFLWSPARYIYLAALLAGTFAYPLMAPWSIDTGWESLFTELQLFLDGVIMTLCLVGPARELFINKEESNSPTIRSKIKNGLKYTGYILGCMLAILLVFLVGLTIYDSIRVHRIKSEAAQIKIGDTKEYVIQTLGEPDDSWNKGDKGLPGPWGASYRPDSGVVYGSIFHLRVLSYDDNDIVIRFEDGVTVSRIRIPEK